MRIASVLLLALLLSSCGHKARVAGGITALAEACDKFVLYSLYADDVPADATARKAAPPFRGYLVRAQTDITDRTEQRELLRALADGVRQSDGSALCFEPRHAIHIEHSHHAVDFVVCFECFRADTYGFALSDGFAVTRSPQAAFDAALQRHHIALADK